MGKRFSTIHALACTGLIFQPELQVETTSMKDVPFFARVFSNPWWSALRNFAIAAGVCAEWRATKQVPGSCAMSSVITSGEPTIDTSRPKGEVAVFMLGSVVGAICPPVIP